MAYTEYSIEPKCPIAEYAAKQALLLAAANRECEQIGDLVSRREAYEAKARFEALLGFRLWVRGTRVG